MITIHWPNSNLCFFSSCRSLTSKIVRLGLADDKFLYGNYMGQDRLFSYPYSYLVPKASPLKVSGSWFNAGLVGMANHHNTVLLGYCGIVIITKVQIFRKICGLGCVTRTLVHA